MPHSTRQRGFTCPKSGKKGYPTYEAAEKGRKWLRSHDVDWVRGRTELETYGPAACCGQYHHTSSKPLGLVVLVT